MAFISEVSIFFSSRKMVIPPAPPPTPPPVPPAQPPVRYLATRSQAKQRRPQTTLQTLWEMEALLQWTDPRGRSALHVACTQGDAKIVAYLLKNQADVAHQAPDNGDTPLHCVVGRPTRFLDTGETYDCKIFTVLLQNGADVGATNKLGNTALHDACKYGHEHFVTQLLDANSDPNAVNMFGNTPLHSASTGDHLGCVEKLLKDGADWSVCNNVYKMPLDCAHRGAVVYCIHEAIKLRIKTFLLILERLQEKDDVYCLDQYMIDVVLGPGGFMYQYIEEGSMWDF